MADDQMTDEPGWPARALLFLVVGALAALAIQQLIEPDDWKRYIGGIPAWHMACATGIGVGALAFGFGLSRVRIAWTFAFAAALGVVAGLIAWWNGQPDGIWSWSGASLFLSVAIAVPLFQVARDEGRASFPYSQVHGHAWTNVVLWGACWGFTGIVLLLSHLLAELFALIGIDFIREILGKNWSNTLIIGAAFGSALALLRDRDKVVRLLQRVVTSVLSFLAPILGVALILFIVSLPFTGLNNLWEATKSTTPTLMACVIGALILANAVIGHGPEDEAKSPVLRWSALALGVSVLPLAVIAAIAMGLRLNQYGMTPDRLWGLTCVIFAVGYGLVYLVAVVRKRLDWSPLIRRDNIRLAFATMAVALVLATPLVGFNAMSANGQVARLKSGKVGVAEFDWRALAFDFGDPGRDALKELSKSTIKPVAERASAVMKKEDRWDVAMPGQEEEVATSTFDVTPAGAVLPETLKKAVVEDSGACRGSAYCRVYLQPGGQIAVAIGDGCMALAPEKRADPGAKCTVNAMTFALRNGAWAAVNDVMTPAAPDVKLTPDQERQSLRKERDAIDAGRIEIRDVAEKQLFIGDKPIGQPFKQP